MYVTCMWKKLLIRHSYEKCMRIKLMKLTPSVEKSFVKYLQSNSLIRTCLGPADFVPYSHIRYNREDLWATVTIWDENINYV